MSSEWHSKCSPSWSLPLANRCLVVSLGKSQVRIPFKLGIHHPRHWMSCQTRGAKTPQTGTLADGNLNMMLQNVPLWFWRATPTWNPQNNSEHCRCQTPFPCRNTPGTECLSHTSSAVHGKGASITNSHAPWMWIEIQAPDLSSLVRLLALGCYAFDDKITVQDPVPVPAVMSKLYP